MSNADEGQELSFVRSTSSSFGIGPSGVPLRVTQILVAELCDACYFECRRTCADNKNAGHRRLSLIFSLAIPSFPVLSPSQ
jgi:hypothetical protein